MQFNKNTSSGKTNIIGLIVKSTIGLVVILGLVFLINKIDFPEPIIPINIRFFFDFISFCIEKTQICLNLKLLNDICNYKKIQVLVKLNQV